MKPNDKICPECGTYFGDWSGGDDEGVWGKDNKNYCSGECVVRRFRRLRKRRRDG